MTHASAILHPIFRLRLSFSLVVMHKCADVRSVNLDTLNTASSFQLKLYRTLKRNKEECLNL
jgi:hypothetical protein